MGTGNIIWLVGILGLIVAIFATIRAKKERTLALLGWTLTGVTVGATIGLTAAVLIGSGLKLELQPLSVRQLAMLRQVNEKSVLFLEQSGRGNTYTYNVMTANEGFSPNVVVADANTVVTIFEDADWAPYVEVWEYTPTSQFLSWLAIVPVQNRDKEYRFHIPQGTLKQGYTLQ